MLPPFLQNGGRVKHSGKKSVGEGQKILILKKGLCYGEGGGGRLFKWKGSDNYSHSIKNNCYLL